MGVEEARKFNNSFPKKYLPLKRVLDRLGDALMLEVSKTGHFDSTRVKELKHIGVGLDLDRRGIPTGRKVVRFHRQRPRISTYQTIPPSREELQDIVEDHAN